MPEFAPVLIPCLPVERAHLAEARRALLARVAKVAGQDPRAQRADVQSDRRTDLEGLSDAFLTRFLWITRALPAVIDVLQARFDARGVRFFDVELEFTTTKRRECVDDSHPQGCEMKPTPPRGGPFFCSAALVPQDSSSERVVEVRVHSGRPDDEEAPCLFLRFPFSINDEDDTIRVQRFVVGRT